MERVTWDTLSANAPRLVRSNPFPLTPVPPACHLRSTELEQSNFPTERNIMSQTSSPLDPLRDRLAKLPDSDAVRWARDLVERAPTSGRTTMRDWMEIRRGRQIDTLQLSGGGSLWAPTARIVDPSRSTYVELGGSRRDYRGSTVVGSSDDMLSVVFTDGTICVYALCA